MSEPKLINVQDYINWHKELKQEIPIDTTNKGDKDFFIDLIKAQAKSFKVAIREERENIEMLLKYPQNETTKAFIHYCQYSIEQLTDRLAEYETFLERNEKK